MIRFLNCALLATALALAFLPGRAAAQQEVSQEITVTELEDLIDAIEDDAERQVLVRRLRTLIEVKKTEAGAGKPGDQALGPLLIEQLALHSQALGQQLSAAAGALLNAPAVFIEFREGLSDPEVRERWIDGLLAFIAVVGAGLLIGWLVRRLLKRPLKAISQRKGEGMLVLVPMLIARLILILIPPIAFAVAGWAVVGIFGHDSVARSVALSVIYAVAIAGAVGAAAHTILAPGAGVRPLNINDETAQYLYIWVRRLTGLGIYGYFGIGITGFLGLSDPAQSFLFKLVGLALTLLAVMLVLQNRKSVAAAIGGRTAGRFATLRRRLADLWHVLAILYVVLVYLVWVTGTPGGFAYIVRATAFSVIFVVAALLLLNIILRIIDDAFSLSPEVKARLPGLEARVNRYFPVIKTILRSFIWVVAALAVLQVWGIDILLWLNEPAGRALLARFASIGTVVLLALVAWEALSAGIERYLASGDALESQRARTLLPLIRKVILVALTVIVGLTILSELGINIAPLLAGAGVVGLAIGFGAQTLVRDIITGLFILIEDTISVGDYVMLSGHEGTVEVLSIRSIRLRDTSGTVHTVPFSDVTTVINYTRDFGYAVLDIGVAYKEDVDAVSRVMEEVGAELRGDPETADSIVEDLQLQGLDRFDDSAVVIKARIKTAPGMQWAVRRAYNRLLKRRFDAEGIEIPFPQQTVWFAEEEGPDARAKLEGRPSGKGSASSSIAPTEDDPNPET